MQSVLRFDWSDCSQALTLAMARIFQDINRCKEVGERFPGFESFTKLQFSGLKGISMLAVSYRNGYMAS